jgi:hypothetical protein
MSTGAGGGLLPHDRVRHQVLTDDSGESNADPGHGEKDACAT